MTSLILPNTLGIFKYKDGQEPLKKKELLNIANFRPTTLVSLYSIIDHVIVVPKWVKETFDSMLHWQAEARFGDDRLEQVAYQ